MDGGTGTVVQPPETHNLFVCLAIIVGLMWIFNSCRRCWAVTQLRRALGSRRLVAIRGAGSRVHIFRLLTRNYLQRNLARNHLQALVHTRQAYPPKAMPCALLVATPFNSSNGGVRATLHPRGVGGQSSPTHPAGAVATRKRATVGVSCALGGMAREGPGDGMLVGVSVELDCRVACTVELLWDVDLAFLRRDMNISSKLQLLPAATREGGSGDVTNSGIRGTSRNLDRSSGARTRGGEGRARGVWFSISRGVWEAVNWIASGINASATTAREDTVRRDAIGGEAEGDAPIPRQQQQGEQVLPAVDEEMGNERSGETSSSSTVAAAVRGREGRDGSGASGGRDRSGGLGNGFRNGSSSWAAAMVFRKSSVAASLGDGGTVTGDVNRDGSGRRGFGHEGGVGVSGWGDHPRCTGAAGGCGKRTVRRALPVGDGHVFEALPGESYFRVRDREESCPRPSIGDSVRAGRCSLAIVIRPADGGDGDEDWRRWRHRPTHRVTRQILLVQLKERERDEAPPSEGSQLQQPPSAEVLRHLVAISGEGQGEAESIYSYSEVFGAGEDTGGATRRSSGPSVVDSAHATAGFGSSSTANASDESSSRQGQGQGHHGHEAGDGAAERGGGAEVPGRGECLPDECVICLTDPKSTLLLPCRHLCVCSECFRHVDKCPVCRAAFDNYVVLQGAAEGVSASAGEVSQEAASGTGGGTGVGERGRAPPPPQERRSIFAVSRRRVAERGAV